MAEATDEKGQDQRQRQEVEEEEEEESFFSRERSPMECPWLIRLALSVRAMLTVRKDGSLNRPLTSLLDRQTPANEKPVDGVSTKDVVIDQTTGVWVRLFSPAVVHKTAAADGEITAPAELLPVILYFHGGGFTTLSAGSLVFDSLCRRFCRRFNAVIVSLDYRKTPAHPFPAAYDDGTAALTWLAASPPAGADVARCFVAGDSAGGNIAHHVACRAAMSGGPMKVRGTVMLCPFFGGEGRTPAERRLARVPVLTPVMCDWAWRAFLPGGSSRDHPAANVAAPGAPELRHVALPPCLVAVGEYDCLKDHQRRYVGELRRAGKDVRLLRYAGAVHGFYAAPWTKSTARLLVDVQQFITSLS